MPQEELSKRIDDVHRRLDDLRADGLQLRQGISQFRQEVHHDLNRRFGQLFWQMNIWFALLMTVYRFLR